MKNAPRVSDCRCAVSLLPHSGTLRRVPDNFTLAAAAAYSSFQRVRGALPLCGKLPSDEEATKKDAPTGKIAVRRVLGHWFELGRSEGVTILPTLGKWYVLPTSAKHKKITYSFYACCLWFPLFVQLWSRNV